jgi:TRAP-type C4-dicarboxylate transport system permease small subunit
MRFVIVGAVSILGAFWFVLSFIHSAWMTATPVPDPAPYERDALVYFVLAITCLVAALATLFVWFRRPKTTAPTNKA